MLYETKDATVLPTGACDAMSAAKKDIWVAFFSPRTAALFVRLAAGHSQSIENLNAACLSDAVAKVAGELPWRNIHVAGRRNSDAMITLMKNNA